MAQIILENPWALSALVVAWFLLLLFAWRRRFRPFGPFLLRLTIVVLVALALAQPVFLPPQVDSQESRGPLVLLVDQSAGLGEVGRAALQAEARRLAGGSPDTVTLFFAGNTRLVPGFSATTPPAVGRVELDLDPEISNLAEALSVGAELLEGQAGRLVLLSDGVPTAGDALGAAARLARQNIPLDVLVVNEAERERWAGSANEVRLVGLEVPPTLRQGERFDIEVTAHALHPAEVTLSLARVSDDTVLAEDLVLLEPGFNLFTFEAEAELVGPQSYQALIAAAEDGQPINNSWFAFSQVFPPPQILVVGDELFQMSRFAGQLEEAGFSADRLRPEEVPARLSELEPYAGMVLLNVSARRLNLEQMIAIQEFVRSLGRGLVVTGGRDSFSLGGYEDTPLAELLPVSLEPPPREERPPVALLLIIDHSGSMVERRPTAAQPRPVTKLAMAKEAAIRATDILGPEDLIGVLMFDNQYEWVVPFQSVSDGAALLALQQAIATIPGGGGTRILQALEVALPALAEQDVASAARHAVLLTDGKSFDGDQGIEDYDLVVEAAQEADITLSTIAIGRGADEELLTHLAEVGRGRYHFAAEPEELPELTIAESDILRSNAVQEGEFQPSLSAPHPIVRGLFSDPTPAERFELGGYIALTPKPRSEVALQVGPGDPLLSVWGYGLGRVVAWATDTGQEWGTDLFAWPESSRFWGQLVGYTLPGPELGLLQVEVEVEPDGVVTLTADGVSSTGQTVEQAPTRATLVTPGGREITLSLRQIAPGRYQQRLRLPDAGAYRVSVTQTRLEEPDETVTTGFVWPYPAEYAIPAEGAGQSLLRELAARTGGRTFELGDVAVTGSESQSDPERGSPGAQELWPWLLLAALALWPVEIAWRRWSRLRIQ